MICEPLIRWPSLCEVALFVGLMTPCFLVGAFLIWHLGRPPRALVIHAAYCVAWQVALLFIRSDVRLALIALWVFVSWLRGPGRRFRDRLVARGQALTEVAREAFRRQASEARA